MITFEWHLLIPIIATLFIFTVMYKVGIGGDYFDISAFFQIPLFLLLVIVWLTYFLAI